MPFQMIESRFVVQKCFTVMIPKSIDELWKIASYFILGDNLNEREEGTELETDEQVYSDSSEDDNIVLGRYCL